MIRRRLTLIVAAFIIAASGLAGVATPASASINPAAFQPGRIIDDAIFYDAAGMGSVSDIQNFLNAHVPACDTWGTQPSGYGNLTNAQYAQQVQGWPGPPYVCLNNYYENPTTHDTSFENGGGAFAGGESAAQIIYDAAQTYHINPKVLLVTLRKESLNLFSDSWPMKSQYKYAMGYACPDSGPNYSANCDASKAGFYNQMMTAAWQLRYYYDHMGTYNYAPGRWNTIQYSPDPSCGTKDVYIENNATASLYIYTPYTPNDASLNAYPGTATCGSYGNRNFWFFWQEWFGSTLLNGNFLRTEANATVYLVGDNTKYPISDPAILSAASALGGVGYVSQSYLDTLTTGSVMGRFIRNPAGTIYFYDANIKLPFTTCAMVTEYGGSCGSEAVLSQAEIDKFVTGPVVTNGMKTTSGKTFYITGGAKKEVLDDQSLSNAGLSTSYNVLTESAFSYLPYGSPYIRNGVVIQNRSDASRQLFGDGTSVFNLKKTAQTDKAFSTFRTGNLDDQSMQNVTTAPQTITDTVADQSSNAYTFTQDGKKQIPNPASFNISSPTLTTATVSQLTGSGTLSDPSLIKSTSDATVYVIVNGQKRPLVSMEDLKSITGVDSPYIGWVSSDLTNSIPTGNIIVGADRLVKTPDSATVYLTDGYDGMVPMSSFDPAIDMGTNMNIRSVSNTILSKYNVASSVLSPYVTCGTTNYLALSGRIYQMSISGKTPQPLQSQTCNVLSVGAQLPGFLKVANGTIYQLNNGTIYPISSWSKYQQLGGNKDNTVDVTYTTIGLLPQGPLL